MVPPCTKMVPAMEEGGGDLNTAALTVRLSDAMALKLSHSLVFDNVPVEGFRKLDQTATVSIVTTLL